MNKNQILQVFTEAIIDFDASGISLKKAVQELSKGNRLNPGLRKFACEVRDGLESGKKLSLVLKKAKSIFIPGWYWSFVAAGEECGRLNQTFQFLSLTLETKKTNREKILGAVAYPLLIVFLTVICLFFVMFFIPFKSSGLKIVNVAGKAAVFLIPVLSVLMVVIKRVFCVDKLELFFNSMAFLFENGVSAGRALDCSYKVVEGDEKLERVVLQIKKKLLGGHSLENAFYQTLCKNGYKKEARIFGEKLSFCEASGSTKGFYQIAKSMENKRKKRQQFFFVLQQPVLLMTAGLFVLVLFREIILSITTGGSFDF